MVRVGDKWGALQCLSVGRMVEQDMRIDADGNEYAGQTQWYNGYLLRCLCGSKFTVAVNKFRGKRLVRDCGCGRSGFRGEHCIVTFSTNSGVKGHVQDLAELDGASVSYIVNTALREYFERRNGEWVEHRNKQQEVIDEVGDEIGQDWS